MEYWHKLFECPFYKWNEKRTIGCEGGRITIESKVAFLEFMETCETKWKSCPIARALMNDAERKYHEEKRT